MSNATQEFTETQYKAIPGQISTNEAQGIVECFVAAIGNKDSVGDICLPGCFNGSLKRRKPRVVWGHNWNEPIGKVLEIYEVGPNDPRLPAKMKTNGVGGLFAKVQFNLKSERGKEAFSNVQFFGEEQEWSIGYKTLDAVFDTGKQANLLKEVELYEVSPVLHGANQLTGTISVKSDKPIKDPKGGLTAAGRAYFKRKEGANLKPGVRGRADTPTKMRRKGSFLTRFFTNPSGPMQDDKGKPTRLALSAAAWGEPVPKNASDAAKLAAKGRRLLERYQNAKQKSDEVFEEIDEKNVQIYSISDNPQNPIIGRMGSLAKALSSHFGGEVRVREADSNVVVFDVVKDGKSETMRASYHTPNETDFMFGSAQPVRVETIYLPLDSNGTPSGAPIPSSPNVISLPKTNSGGCGCGGKCGMKSSPFATWDDFKNTTPGIHLFIKTENIEMFEVANDIAEYHGFDVELLEDGFVVPNIDWYEEGARKALLSAVDAIEEKALGRLARGAMSPIRRMGRRFKPSSRDGDGDGFETNPLTGEDDLPAKRRPKAPKMMPPRRVPEEVPIEEPKPTTIPRRVPKPSTVPQPVKPPVKPPVPAPSRPAEVPQRPTVPAGVSGAMRGSQILRELEQLNRTGMGPSVLPQRAINVAIREIAKRNNITEAQARKRLRRAIAIRRSMDAAKRMMRMRKASASAFMSIPEASDIEVKSARTGEFASIIVPVEQQFIFSVKQMIDPVAEYYGVKMDAVEEGIQIFNSDSLDGDAIEAASSAIHAAFMQVSVEDEEISKALGLKLNSQ